MIRRALRDAAGAPALVLLTTMAGFGTLARAVDMSVAMAIVATVGIWGLPGQVVMAEMVSAGAGFVAIVVACSLANARFLPMTISFLPLVQQGVRSRFALLGLGQLLSINSWAMCLRVFPNIAQTQRRLYYVVFAGTILCVAVVGTATGYYAVGALPRPVTLGFLFINPLFFALVLADMRGRSVAIAMILGAVSSPLIHLLSADWGLLLAGVIAGSLAFLISRRGSENSDE
ncbi:MAG: AzlC family ABC transporter permease [Gammaproteobacteria bacterium]